MAPGEIIEVMHLKADVGTSPQTSSSRLCHWHSEGSKAHGPLRTINTFAVISIDTACKETLSDEAKLCTGWETPSEDGGQRSAVPYRQHLMESECQRMLRRTEERKCENAGVSLHVLYNWGQGRRQSRTSSPAFSIRVKPKENPQQAALTPIISGIGTGARL